MYVAEDVNVAFAIFSTRDCAGGCLCSGVCMARDDRFRPLMLAGCSVNTCRCAVRGRVCQEQRAPNVNNRETPHQALSSHVGNAVAITIPHVDTSAFHRHIYDHKQARSPCESERDVDRSAARQRERMVGAQRARTHAPKDDILDRIPEDRVGAVEALFEVLKETHRRQQTKRDGAAAASADGGTSKPTRLGPKLFGTAKLEAPL